MDNRELYGLLVEAAELLNEGARYRKEIKDEQGDSSHSIGKYASKLYARKDNLGGIIWNTAGKLVASNIKDDINPDSKSLQTMARYMTGEMSDEEKKEYERKEKSKELHDKINNKSIRIAISSLMCYVISFIGFGGIVEVLYPVVGVVGVVYYICIIKKYKSINIQ